MDIAQMLKSVVDLDEMAVVICDINHTIVYMNGAAAEKYAKYGGLSLIGKNLLDCHNEKSCASIKNALAWFMRDTKNNKFYTHHKDKENQDVYTVALRDENGSVIGYYEKFESRKPYSAE